MGLFKKCCGAECDVTDPSTQLPSVKILGAALDEPVPMSGLGSSECCFLAWLALTELTTDGTRIDSGVDVNVGSEFPGVDGERWYGHYRHLGYEVMIERRNINCGGIDYLYYVEVKALYEFGVGYVGYNGTFNINTATNWYCWGILDPYCSSKPRPFDGNYPPGVDGLWFRFSKLFTALPYGVVVFDACVDTATCSPVVQCEQQVGYETCDDPEFCFDYDAASVCFTGPTSITVEFV